MLDSLVKRIEHIRGCDDYCIVHITWMRQRNAEVMYGIIEGHEVTMIEGGIWKDRLAIQLEVKIYMILMGAIQMQN